MKLTNIKRRLRSDSAGYRAAVLKTGGGPPPTPPVLRSEGESALYNQIALSVDGLPTVGDSDEMVYEEYLVSEDDEDEKGDDDDKDEDYEEDDDESDDEDDDGEEKTIECQQVFQPEDILDLDVVLERDAAITTTTTATQVATTSTTTQATQPACSSNWNKYNPKMLRKPKNPALRTAPPTPAVNSSARNLPSSIIALREEEIKQKMKFQSEKHEKAMQLEDGKLREQELRIKLLEAELRLKSADFYP